MPVSAFAVKQVWEMIKMFGKIFILLLHSGFAFVPGFITALNLIN
jgi:hypothetical protein